MCAKKEIGNDLPRGLYILYLNVLKIGPVTELEKLSVHGSLVKLVVESRLNR